MIKQTMGWVMALAAQGLMTAGAVQAMPGSGWAAALAGDRLGWAQEPHARVSDRVTMAAEPITAPGGVEFRFSCLEGGGPSSEWQTASAFEAKGLQPETRYVYLQYFPHGTYSGTFTTADGKVCQAEAYVVQNKGGIFVDDRAGESDYGYWIRLAAYPGGPLVEPVVMELKTRSEGRMPEVLAVYEQTKEETLWKGKVADGRLEVSGAGPKGGTYTLLYISRPPIADQPLAVGAEFAPTAAGNYYVAAQRADTGAISVNRVGVAVTMGGTVSNVKPLKPNNVAGRRRSDSQGCGVSERGKGGSVPNADALRFLCGHLRLSGQGVPRFTQHGRPLSG